MKRLVLLACVGLPVSLLAEGGLPNQPYIYVDGQAEIQQPPSMVTMQFDLVARHADQAKANQEVQANAGKILTMLNEKKVAENDVIAQGVRSEPRYEDDDNRRGKIIGYSVTRRFQVKLREVSIFAKVVDDLLAVPGVEFTDVESGLTNEKETVDQMWAKALGNARENAEKTLTTLGMKIDAVFAVSPVSVSDISSRITARGERVVVTGSYIPTTEKVEPRQYRLAPVTVSQTVHIIYLISPAK